MKTAGRESTRRLLAGILVLSCFRLLAAASDTASFETANRLYEQGRFKEAANAYVSLLNSGFASSAVHFNLGNAFFKSGDLGRAIAAYRQAHKLAPRDPDVRANLQFVREQVEGPRVTPSRFQRWLEHLTLDEWACLATGALWIALFSMAALQLRPAWKSTLRRVALVTGCATLILGGCLAGAWSFSTQPMAIVISDSVSVRSGPLDEGATLYTMRDGAEARILDQKANWLLVETGPQRGWLKQKDVLVRR
jgi:tetratricopeptide (TPR) repeat protein